MSAPRDRQRAKLYRAEESIDGGRTFASVSDIQAFVDRVVASPAWERIPNAPRHVTVRDGRGRRHACASPAWYGAEIKLPRWSRTQLIVLHELAHTITPADCAPHGPEYARAYLNLVRRHLSEEHYEALGSAFEAGGVEVAPAHAL